MTSGYLTRPWLRSRFFTTFLLPFLWVPEQICFVTVQPHFFAAYCDDCTGPTVDLETYERGSRKANLAFAIVRIASAFCKFDIKKYTDTRTTWQSRRIVFKVSIDQTPCCARFKIDTVFRLFFCKFTHRISPAWKVVRSAGPHTVSAIGSVISVIMKNPMWVGLRFPRLAALIHMGNSTDTKWSIHISC